VLAQLGLRIDALEREGTDRWRAADPYRDAALTRVYMVTTAERTDIVTERPRDLSEFVLTRAERTIDGDVYYRLDGEKLFTIRPNDDCMLNLSSTGIVVTNAQGIVVAEDISSQSWAEYCGDRASTDTPLATVQVGADTPWVLKSSLEDGYDYLRLNPVTRKVLKLEGGGTSGK